VAHEKSVTWCRTGVAWHFDDGDGGANAGEGEQAAEERLEGEKATTGGGMVSRPRVRAAGGRAIVASPAATTIIYLHISGGSAWAHRRW